jgi:hypothetical protein
MLSFKLGQNFPVNALRLLFKDGISTLTKLPASTKFGIMFALVVASVTRDGRKAFDAISEDEYNDVMYAFEQVWCYWPWLKKDHHWSKNDLINLKLLKRPSQGCCTI